MALAIHFDGLIRKGIVRDYADLARLGGLTRARITQIMNLLNLSPKIRERLLCLEGPERGRDGVTEREMRAAAKQVGWAPSFKPACTPMGATGLDGEGRM